ncbi:hypothetical protein GQ53DRAFT_53624 [Thozetella sp. PMI_491]|nr:hypothetical protein GQ53DRAFT_53624 [Thozetella sp. PMI_491]
MRHNADPFKEDFDGKNAFSYANGLARAQIIRALRYPGPQCSPSSASVSSPSRAEAPTIVPSHSVQVSTDHLRPVGLRYAPSTAPSTASSRLRNGNSIRVRSFVPSIFSRASSRSCKTLATDHSRNRPPGSAPTASMMQSISDQVEPDILCSPPDDDATTDVTDGSRQGSLSTSSLDLPKRFNVPLHHGRYKGLGSLSSHHDDEKCHASPASSTEEFAQSSVPGSHILSEQDQSGGGLDSHNQSSPPITLTLRNHSHGHHLGVRQHQNTNAPDGQPLAPGAIGGAASSSQPSLCLNQNNTFGDSGAQDQGSSRVGIASDGSDDSLSNGRQFACPFGKIDFLSYPQCTRAGFTRVRDVKQHINRAHYHPFYCSRCFEECDSQQARDQHIRMCQVIRDGRPRGITEEQKRSLAKQCPRSLYNNHEGQWFFMFGIVFPHRERPQSPYVELDPLIVCDILRDFVTKRIHHYTPELQGLLDRQLGANDVEHVARIFGSVIFDFMLMIGPQSPSEHRPQNMDRHENSESQEPLEHTQGSTAVSYGQHQEAQIDTVAPFSQEPREVVPSSHRNRWGVLHDTGRQSYQSSPSSISPHVNLTDASQHYPSSQTSFNPASGSASRPPSLSYSFEADFLPDAFEPMTLPDSSHLAPSSGQPWVLQSQGVQYSQATTYSNLDFQC